MLTKIIKSRLTSAFIITMILMIITNVSYGIDKKFQTQQISSEPNTNKATVSSIELQQIGDKLKEKLSSYHAAHAQPSPLSQSIQDKNPTQFLLNKMINFAGQYDIEIHWHEKNSTPTFISINNNEGSLSKSGAPLTAKAIAIEFFKNNTSLFQLENPETELKIAEETTCALGKIHLKFHQYYKGVPVWGHDIIVHLDKQNQMYAINARYAPTPKSIEVTRHNLSSQSAVQIAVKDLEKIIPVTVLPDWAKLSFSYQQPHAKKYIWMDDKAQQPYLVWHVQIRPNIRDNWYYFMDAQNGIILEKYNATNFDGPATAQAIDLNGVTQTVHSYQVGSIYYMIDASHPMWQTIQPDLLNDARGAIVTLDVQGNDLNQYAQLYHVISGNNTWGDPVSVSAHSNMGYVFDYYFNVHGRSGIDGNGSTILSMIHVTDGGQPMDNAYWSGAFIVYGDGNMAFKPTAGALDVAAHEAQHGVTQHTIGLEYKFQSGALNESFSDVFAVMVDRDDWKIGEDIVNSAYFPSGTMRDMEDPHNGAAAHGNGWQPKYMNEFLVLDITQDNGGVHINCGIPNYACYLIGNAIGKDKTEKIYYRIVDARYLNTQSNFVDMRMATIQAATDLYGDGSSEVNAVIAAFDAVGIGSSGGSQPNPDLPPVAGEEWIATIDYQTEALYLAKPVIQNQNTDIIQLTSTQVSAETGNPISVTDDGSLIIFVDKNHYIRIINSDGTDEQVISNDAVWNSVSFSPNGMMLAATTTLQDSSIYIFDLSGNNNNKKIRLYSPTTQEGVRNYTTVLADAMDWNLSSDYLIYDSFTSISQAGGGKLEYWSINVLDPATDIIYLLFPPQPEGVSIGNPSFGQTNDIYFVFDYIDQAQGIYQVRSANLYTGEVFLVEDNGNSVGYPRYSPDDRTLVFQRWESDGLNQFPTLRQIELKESKTEPAGSSIWYVKRGMLPTWFAIGQRSSNVAMPDEVQPTDFLLAQNYPNPFNPATKISYAIPQPGFVTLKIYDMVGREVQTLVNEFQKVGRYTLDFNGRKLATGVYFYKLQVGDRFSEIKKMLYIK